MPARLVPANRFSLSELTEILDAGYEGYYTAGGARAVAARRRVGLGGTLAHGRHEMLLQL